MKTWKKAVLCVCAVVFAVATVTVIVNAGGPPLKEKTCSACHQDYAKILPKPHPDVDKSAPCLSCHAQKPGSDEPTKFSTGVHKAHQGEKTKLECNACHAL